MNRVKDRVLRVLHLSPGVFEELAADPRATRQGLFVGFSAIAASGLFLLWPGEPRFSVGTWLSYCIFLSLSTLAWTAIAYLVLKLIRESTDFFSLLRVIGYSAVPLTVGAVPLIGLPLGVLGFLVTSARAVWEIEKLSRLQTMLVVGVPTVIFVVAGVSLWRMLARLLI